MQVNSADDLHVNLRHICSWGLPYWTVLIGSLFALLSYMNAGASTAGEVFGESYHLELRLIVRLISFLAGWFANMTSVAGLVTWQGIFFIYFRFYKGVKRQGIDRRAEFPYVAPLQPWLSIYGFVSFIF